jgi:hypothetical protein
MFDETRARIKDLRAFVALVLAAMFGTVVPYVFLSTIVCALRDQVRKRRELREQVRGFDVLVPLDSNEKISSR